jgi:hypothetical protein
MSGYLPLRAFRQGLLPAPCRACAWWQTTGGESLTADAAADKRRRWMSSLEETWGTTGLLLESGGRAGATGESDDSRGGAPAPSIAASINFAPTAALPRWRELPFGPLPDEAIVLFCLLSEEDQPRYQQKRILHKALHELKTRRGAQEVYAVAGASADAETAAPRAARGARRAGAGATGPGRDDSCRFFSADFLAANGFESVMEEDGLLLMRVDLRGLLALVGQVQMAIRRVLGDEPTPSPAAWSQRETS